MSEQKTCLVLGAASGIGLGLVQALAEDHAFGKVIATQRPSSASAGLEELRQAHPRKLICVDVDVRDESDFDRLGSFLREDVGTLDWSINAVGILHTDGARPERRVDEVTQESMSSAFLSNTMPTLLLAKAIKPLFRQSNAPVFAAISAKVGSLTDNRVGGWHSYRMSKAALNMALVNLSIEFGRLNKNGIVLSLHPGTTASKLSKPFLETAAKRYIIHTPDDTAKNLLAILKGINPREDNGVFFNWDGARLPW